MVVYPFDVDETLGHVRWRPCELHPQSRDCARLLRSGGERRGEEAEDA